MTAVRRWLSRRKLDRLSKEQRAVAIFIAHEGEAGIEFARKAMEAHSSGTKQLYLNVFWLTFDFDASTAHLEHDFDPIDERMSIDDFLTNLETLRRR